MIFNSKTAYGSVNKLLHAVIALLVIGMLAGGFFLDDIIDPQVKGWLINGHKCIGLLILTLMVLRLVWRSMNKLPMLPATVPKWQQLAARMAHRLFYVLLIFMPLTGWVMSTAAGHAPHLGTWQLPLPGIHPSEAVSNTFFNYHSTLAWVIIAVIVLHLGAAIQHKLWRRIL